MIECDEAAHLIGAPNRYAFQPAIHFVAERLRPAVARCVERVGQRMRQTSLFEQQCIDARPIANDKRALGVVDAALELDDRRSDLGRLRIN